MRLYLLFLSFTLVLSCSKNIDNYPDNSVVITSEKEIISDLASLEEKFYKFINNSSVQNISIQEIFENSWLSSIKTDHSLNKALSIEIKEHHPIASTGNDRYLTQAGKSIYPKGKSKKLNLVKIKGPEESLLTLLGYSRQLQAKLNRLDLRVMSLELKNGGLLKAKDDSGAEYIFSSKEFRVQLERLEDYISFELNSGKRNHIRYIDFRYNNAIAVFYS